MDNGAMIDYGSGGRGWTRQSWAKEEKIVTTVTA